MALSAETTAWLADLKSQGSLSDEVLTQLRSAAEANSKTDEFLKGSVLRQSDYSRNSADLQKAKTDFEKTQKDLADKEVALTKFQTELGQWKQGADTQIIAAQKDRESAEVKATAALARLQRIGVQHGIDESEWKLGDTDFTPAKKDDTVDTSKFITSEKLNEIVSKGTRDAAVLDAIIYDLGEEHRELFGKRLPAPAALVQEALATGKTLTGLWEEKYGVQAKRSEIAEKAITDRISAGVEAEVTRRMSDASLPGAHLMGARDDLQGAPVFKEGGLPAPTSEGGGVSAAIAAFRSGKFSASAKR